LSVLRLFPKSLNLLPVIFAQLIKIQKSKEIIFLVYYIKLKERLVGIDANNGKLLPIYSNAASVRFKHLSIR